MSDYIKREYIMREILEEYGADFESEDVDKIYDMVINAPPADVAPVRHGRWEDYEENTWQCSECGELFYLEDGTPQENEYRYCPNCGAKMDEEKEDEL